MARHARPLFISNPIQGNARPSISTGDAQGDGGANRANSGTQGVIGANRADNGRQGGTGANRANSGTQGVTGAIRSVNGNAAIAHPPQGLSRTLNRSNSMSQPRRQHNNRQRRQSGVYCFVDMLHVGINKLAMM